MATAAVAVVLVEEALLHMGENQRRVYTITC